MRRGAAAGLDEQRLRGIDRRYIRGTEREHNGRASVASADVEDGALVNAADHVREDVLLLGRDHRTDGAAKTALFETTH